MKVFKSQENLGHRIVTDSQSLMWAYKDEDRAALEIRYFL
jgi:hypothetical protein